MTAVGTPLYIAPEIWARERYDESVDMYESAITVWALELVLLRYGQRLSVHSPPSAQICIRIDAVRAGRKEDATY